MGAGVGEGALIGLLVQERILGRKRKWIAGRRLEAGLQTAWSLTTVSVRYQSPVKLKKPTSAS